MEGVLERGARFIYANARLLETVVFEYALLGGPAEAVIRALSAYQLPGGGFGCAIRRVRPDRP